jgi:transposase
MQKISTMRTSGKNVSKGSSRLGWIGEIILVRIAFWMKQTFGRVQRSRIAMETGTHSPWVSRLLTALGQEVIVAHAQNVRLIVKSRRKDDRLDARTLARLVPIDPELPSPVQHRSARAQLHLTEIRARAGLASARTALVNAARGW